MSAEPTQIDDETGAGDWGPNVPSPLPTPGATVHHSHTLGQATVLADQGIRASDLSSALARFLPGGVRLVEATAHAGTVMLVFESGAAPLDSV